MSTTVSPSKTPLSWAMVALAVVLTSVLVCPCGIAIGMWLGMMRTPAATIMGKVADVKPAVIGKSPEDWGWQDLQDHLASKGLKTSRGEAGGGMFFKPGDGKPLDMISSGLSEGGNRASWMEASTAFTARQFPNTETARKSAATIKDAQQRDVLAWGRFTFEGSAKTRAELKRLLP
jgi:hypothetical protein